MTPTVFFWNPRPYVFGYPLRRVLPVRRRARLNNFGDILAPLVVEHMLARRGIVFDASLEAEPRLFTIGSVLHFARDGDVVWGSGRNGKKDDESHAFRVLDVRAVRGPLTQDFLVSKGIAAPAVFGDPGLLIPEVFPHLKELARSPKHAITIIPNLNDMANFEPGPDLIDPRAPLMHVLERIAGSEFVTGSSLHALVIAESLGIPARAVSSRHESRFKYEDYYLGTGRSGYEPAVSPEAALSMGGEKPLRFDRHRLEAAFPYDLWEL